MFLSRPARGRITQTFTDTHRALDFGWGLGKTVRAAAAGEVRLQADSFYGLRVFIEHGGGHETEYSHLAGRYVKDGQHVKAKQAIGLMGNSGSYAKYVHLHFAHWVNGVRIKPVFGKTTTTTPAGTTGTPIVITEQDDDMKFLKHKTQDIWYLVGEFTVTRTRELTTARLWKQGYGDSEPCTSDALKSLITVAETNAATRDAQTAAAVKTVISGGTANVVVDYARIKKNTAELLAGVPDDVADELAERLAN